MTGPGAGTVAIGTNDRGAIVGFYAGGFHGFLDKGAFTTIDIPGTVETTPSGINDYGHIVGEYSRFGGSAHGFVLF